MQLKSDIEIASPTARLRETGRALVADILTDDAARAIEHCLRDDVPWSLACRLGDESKTIGEADYAALDESKRSALLEEVVARRSGDFCFAYESYMMIPAYLEKRHPDLLLNRVLEFLNSPGMIGFCRALTGDERVRRLDAQATRYRPGHFLRAHDDRHEKDGRLYAYVLGLTHSWQPDWGGLLQFQDGRRVLETFVPNMLSVFRVPATHCVTPVAPWAETARHSITGWMLT